MLNFYRCNTCGNLIEIIDASGVVPVCCGHSMDRLIPSTIENAMEKHLPLCPNISGLCISGADTSDCCKLTVKVGQITHPMTEEHYIQWILLQTNQGIYRKMLTPSEAPKASFYLQKDEKVIAIYSYCNIHGLWVNIFP